MDEGRFRSQSAAPATKSAHGGSQSAAPATKSAHGGSQSAVPATESALQETSENSNRDGGTIPTMIRSDHDPRPSRNRRSAELPRRGSEKHGGSQSAAPATKSAHGGSQSAAPAMKSAHGGSQSAVPAT